jgi:hypothetical protein
MEHILPEIDEEAGELLCDKCEGKGSTPSNQDPCTMAAICNKCQGRGKVDWISHITGVPELSQTSNSSSSWASMSMSLNTTQSYAFVGSTFGNGCINKDVDDHIMYKMAKRLATKIDEEISDSIIKEGNKHINLYNPGGKVFDNGIIS